MFGDKIKKARKDKFTQVELSEKAGISRSILAQYETDKVMPPINALKEIADVCGVDMLFFFDDANKTKKQIVKKELKTNFAEYVDYLPDTYSSKDTVFLDKIEMRAGAGAEGVFDMELFNSSSKVAIDRSFIGSLNPRNLKLITVLGDSMEPEYEEGDLAIIDMLNNRGNFTRIGGIYVIRMGDIVHIKRVEFLAFDDIIMHSLNPKYGAIRPKELGYECEIIGKVCGKISFRTTCGFVFGKQGIS